MSAQRGAEQMARMKAKNGEVKKINEYRSIEKHCADCEQYIPVGTMHVMMFRPGGGRVYRCEACWKQNVCLIKK